LACHTSFQRSRRGMVFRDMYVSKGLELWCFKMKFLPRSRVANSNIFQPVPTLCMHTIAYFASLTDFSFDSPCAWTLSMSPVPEFSVDSVDSLPNGSTNMSPLNQPSLNTNWFQTPQQRHTTTPFSCLIHGVCYLGIVLFGGQVPVELTRVPCSDVPHGSTNLFFGAPKVIPWNTGHCRPHRPFQKMSGLK
jgi:hypothetical protein